MITIGKWLNRTLLKSRYVNRQEEHENEQMNTKEVHFTSKNSTVKDTEQLDPKLHYRNTKS